MKKIKDIAKKIKQGIRYPFVIISNIFSVNKIILSEYGFWTSTTRGKPITKNGEALPWFTYPAIKYLESLNLTNADVFEYGSGMSSIFFAKRVRNIISVEDSKYWFDYGQKHKSKNMELVFATTKSEYVDAIGTKKQKFDIIIIDGEHRPDCAEIANFHLKEDGLIILDNADWYPEVCKMLTEKKLIQVNFTGLGPINPYQWTTAFFFSPKAHPKIR